jgi:tetratricopeptide (TPR) repeat protein
MTIGQEHSALVNAARSLMNQNDAVGAERVLAPVFRHLKTEPAVLQMMAMIKKAQGRLDEAERFLRKAITYALSDGGYYSDLGIVLQMRGEYGEAARILRAALALLPDTASVRVNLVNCLMGAREFAQAEHECHAYIAAHPGPEGWTLLHHVQRDQERYDDALNAAETALKLAPATRGLQYNFATALDRVGRAQEALNIYEGLASERFDTPELALNFMRALYAANRKQDAEAIGARGVKHWPGALAIHGALARMRMLRGEGENATALLDAEIAKRPRELSLRLACADILHRGHLLPKALRQLEEALALAPDAPALLTAAGIVLDDLGRTEEGLEALRRVLAQAPQSRSARRNMLSTLLRAGRPEEALAIVRALRAEDRDEQYMLATEATALRMLGEPAYRQICDYEQMVRCYDIAAPRGHFSAESFNSTLAEVLRAQHRASAHPLDQHLHNGTQTGRSLLNSQEPAIKGLLAAVDDSVRDYISRLRGADPVSARRADRYRYAGLWSVRLGHEGFQPNHVHDRGWISSAYYVAMTPSEKQSDPRAGWLKLGEPNRPPAGCGPEKFIEPKLGRLVLFPSYFWHGTVPFEGSERLSAAFDVVPSAT